MPYLASGRTHTPRDECSKLIIKEVNDGIQAADTFWMVWYTANRQISEEENGEKTSNAFRSQKHRGVNETWAVVWANSDVMRSLPLHGLHFNCWKLCSSKVENSEEKTRRLRIGSSAEFLYSMTCVVICSHRRSHLSHFYRVSYRQNWRRDS